MVGIWTGRIQHATEFSQTSGDFRPPREDEKLDFRWLLVLGMECLHSLMRMTLVDQ